MPIFVVGLVACAFAIVAAIYTIWTVVHGCLHSETSPFQSTLSHFLVVNGPVPLQRILQVYRAARAVLSLSHIHLCNLGDLPLLCSVSSMTSGRQDTGHFVLPSQNVASDDHDTDPDGVPIEMSLNEHEAFHATLLQTHEDHILNQAVAALEHIMTQRRRTDMTLDGHFGTTHLEIQSMCFLLSADASLTANLTISALILDLIRIYGWQFDLQDSFRLLRCITRTAERMSRTSAMTRQEHSSFLWQNTTTTAMYLLLNTKSAHLHSHPTFITASEYDNDIPCAVGNNAPILGMLLIEEAYHSSTVQSLGPLLIGVMKSQLGHSQDHFVWDRRDDFDTKMKRVLSSQRYDTWSGLITLFERDSGQIIRKSITVLAPSTSTMDRELAYIHRSLVHALYHPAPKGFPRILIPASVCGIETVLEYLRLPSVLGDPYHPNRVKSALLWMEILLDGCNNSLSPTLTDGDSANEPKVDEIERLPPDFQRLLCILIKVVATLDILDSVQGTIGTDPNHSTLEPHSNEDGRTFPCSCMCHHRLIVQSFVEVIHQLVPELTLNEAQWQGLQATLNSSSPDYGRDFASVHHRDKVKQSILEAFRTISPDADGKSSQPTPWPPPFVFYHELSGLLTTFRTYVRYDSMGVARGISSCYPRWRAWYWAGKERDHTLDGKWRRSVRG